MTASLDRHVKIWSRCGEPWGDIVTYGENPVVSWSFPYDWTEEREQEKTKVLDVMKEIEPKGDYGNVKIEYAESREARKIRLTKRLHGDHLIPKRSLVKPSEERRQKAQGEREPAGRGAKRGEDDRLFVAPEM